MVHKICQKFYKSAVFPKNKARLFSKIVILGAENGRTVLAKNKGSSYIFMIVYNLCLYEHK